MRAQSLRGLLGPAGRQLRGRRGPDGRDPRPQRLGEVDAAQVRVGHPPAHRGQGRRAGQPGRAAGARRRVPARALGAGEHLPERVAAGAVDEGGRQALRRDRGLRRARAVHRQPGQVLLVGHVRPSRLRRGGERRSRHPGGGRGAGRRGRELPAQVHGPDQGVPGRRAHHPVRHPLRRPRAPDLRPGRRPRARGTDDRLWALPPRPCASTTTISHRGSGPVACRPPIPKRRPSPRHTAPVHR